MRSRRARRWVHGGVAEQEVAAATRLHQLPRALAEQKLRAGGLDHGGNAAGVIEVPVARQQNADVGFGPITIPSPLLVPHSQWKFPSPAQESHA